MSSLSPLGLSTSRPAVVSIGLCVLAFGGYCYFQESILFLAIRLGSSTVFPTHFLPQIVCSHSYPPTLILSTYTHTSEFLLPSQYMRVHHFQLPCRCLHILVLSLTFTCGIAHNYNVTLTFDACQDQKILEVILMSHKRSTQLQECPLNAKAQKSCLGPFEFPVVSRIVSGYLRVIFHQ